MGSHGVHLGLPDPSTRSRCPTADRTLRAVENVAVVSATGVSGVRYKRQRELSTDLSMKEKRHYFPSLRSRG